MWVSRDEPPVGLTHPLDFGILGTEAALTKEKFQKKAKYSDKNISNKMPIINLV